MSQSRGRDGGGLTPLPSATVMNRYTGAPVDTATGTSFTRSNATRIFSRDLLCASSAPLLCGYALARNPRQRNTARDRRTG